MKLAQGQQREVEGGNWTAAGPQESQREHEAPESPSSQATPAREDDPYRGMSDGEMLQYEF